MMGSMLNIVAQDYVAKHLLLDSFLGAPIQTAVSPYSKAGMTTSLRDFLEIPYDELEDRNLINVVLEVGQASGRFVRVGGFTAIRQ